MENDLKLYELMSSMLLGMAQSIPDDQFHLLPAGGGNSPNWILGHLCLANGFGLQLLGQQPEILALTGPAYGPGSTPTEDTSKLISKADLISHYQSSKTDFINALSSADAALFDQPQPTEILKEQLPTMGDFLRHLLTTHLALHTGQLSAWRRSRGLPSAMQI